MAKQTKRARKFIAKGGVKARLEKGTITRKGKLKPTSGTSRKRKNESNNNEHHTNHRRQLLADHHRAEQEQKREDADFVSPSNLGDLDMDEFFETLDSENEQNDVSVKDEERPSDNDEGSTQDDDEESDQPANDNENDSEDNESDSDDESDQDNIEAASKRMKLEMNKLKSSDPEFHKFLSENEKSLLEFDEGEEDDDEENGMQEEDGVMEEKSGDREERAQKKDDDKSSPYILLTSKLLMSYEQGAFKSHGIKSLKKIVSAYKSACHLSDPSSPDEKDDAAANTKGRGRKQQKKSYHIDSSEVFDQLMVMCLNNCHEEFHYHLVGKGSVSVDPSVSSDKKKQTTKSGKEEQEEGMNNLEIDKNKPLNPKMLMKSENWIAIQPILQSFLKSTIHVLTEAKEPELLTFILKALSNYIPYMTPFPRVATGMLTTLTSLWSAPLDSSEDYQVVRLNAFFRIRQMTLTQPFPFIEDCLKKTYLAYAKRAKFGNAAATLALPTLVFMGNCVVELYSLDYHSSYQHAFVYIRQLALHLRTAMQKKTTEAFQVVYCWQYMHCLKLWTAVLSSASSSGQLSSEDDGDDDVEVDGGPSGDESQLLRSLIYPLVEVILGVARLVPTTRHLPLRLHCVRLLQQLAASAEIYIPTTSILLEVLDLKEIDMKPKRIKSKGTARGLMLPLILKLPKEAPLRTSEQLEACMSEVFLLLNREIDLYRYSAGFPEFSVRIIQRLRKFSKETRNGRWRAYSKGCIELCDRHSSFAVKGRSTLSEAPKDVKRLEVLKPVNEPSMHKRYESSIAKEKRLEAASRPATSATVATMGKAPEKTVNQREKDMQSRKHPKNKKAILAVNESDLKNTGVLEQEDQVEEGIHWSDDGEESD